MLAVVCLAQLVLLAYFIYERGQSERAGAARTADLLQRIQAPEVAVVQHQLATPVYNPPPLPFEDDEAFHKTREELAAELNLS